MRQDAQRRAVLEGEAPSWRPAQPGLAAISADAVAFVGAPRRPAGPPGGYLPKRGLGIVIGELLGRPEKQIG